MPIFHFCFVLINSWVMWNNTLAQTMWSHRCATWTAKPSGSAIQPDDGQRADVHRCANTKVHTAAKQSSISDPTRLMLLIKSPGSETPMWVRALPAAGSFPAPPCLIHGCLLASSAHSPQQHMQIHMYTNSTRTHTQTKQGHQPKWNLICRNKLMRFASF